MLLNANQLLYLFNNLHLHDVHQLNILQSQYDYVK